MSEHLPKAKFGSADRPVKIGNIEIPCYVLEDGRRVLVQSGIVFALDMKRGSAGRTNGSDRLSSFAATKSINPFITEDLLNAIKNPIRFQPTPLLAVALEPA